MIAYKLFRVRADGTLGPLFIDATLRVPVGKIVRAKAVHKNGFKFRPGFHAVPKPYAPHLSKKGRRWYRVKLWDWHWEQRPKNHGSCWLVAKEMKVLRPA